MDPLSLRDPFEEFFLKDVFDSVFCRLILELFRFTCWDVGLAEGDCDFVLVLVFECAGTLAEWLAASLDILFRFLL